MSSKSKQAYSQPTVEQYGHVAAVTEQTDKIGDADDDVDFGNLDGSIVNDP